MAKDYIKLIKTINNGIVSVKYADMGFLHDSPGTTGTVMSTGDHTYPYFYKRLVNIWKNSDQSNNFITIPEIYSYSGYDVFCDSSKNLYKLVVQMFSIMPRHTTDWFIATGKWGGRNINSFDTDSSTVRFWSGERATGDVVVSFNKNQNYSDYTFYGYEDIGECHQNYLNGSIGTKQTNTSTASSVGNLALIKHITIPKDITWPTPKARVNVSAGMHLSGQIVDLIPCNNNWRAINSFTDDYSGNTSGYEDVVLEILTTTNSNGGQIRFSGPGYAVDDHLVLSSSLGNGNTCKINCTVGNHTLFSDEFYIHKSDNTTTIPVYTDFCICKKKGRILIQYMARSEDSAPTFTYYSYEVKQKDIEWSKTLKLFDDSYGCSTLLNPQYGLETKYILVQGYNSGWAGVYDYSAGINGSQLAAKSKMEIWGPGAALWQGTIRVYRDSARTDLVGSFTRTAASDDHALCTFCGIPNTTYYFSGDTYGSCSITSDSFTTPDARGTTTPMIYCTNSQQYNVTLNMSTGISRIYYKQDTESSYSSTTETKTITVDAGRQISWYAKASTGYTGDNIGSSSQPNIITINSNTPISPTATPNKYTLTLTKNSNIASIMYKISPNTRWYSVTNSTTLQVSYGATVSLYAAPESGYTSEYLESNPLTIEMSTQGYEFSPVAWISGNIPIIVTGTYADYYEGNVQLRQGSAAGTVKWSSYIDSGTEENSVIGSIARENGATYYPTGDEYNRGRFVYFISNTPITISASTTSIPIRVNRQGAMTCPNTGCTGYEGLQ